MTNSRRHDELARELRAEANGAAGRFSEPLHDRVMGALAAEQSSSLLLRPPTRQRNWPLAAAATVIIGAALAVYFAAQMPPSVVPPRVQSASRLRVQVPTPAQILNQTTQPLLHELGDLPSRTYAAADTDARNLARFVARQLDLAVPPSPVQ